MNEQTNNPNPKTPETQSPGSMIGSVIVVVILIIGAIYLFSTRDRGMAGNELPGQDAALETLQNQSDSDELADIEADLEATDLGLLEAGVEDLNQATP